jgi:hypothetical protein
VSGFGTFCGVGARIPLVKRKRDDSPDGFEPPKGKGKAFRGRTGTEGYQVSSDPGILTQSSSR